jgi:hypothetical protein
VVPGDGNQIKTRRKTEPSAVPPGGLYFEAKSAWMLAFTRPNPLFLFNNDAINALLRAENLNRGGSTHG